MTLTGSPFKGNQWRAQPGYIVHFWLLGGVPRGFSSNSVSQRGLTGAIHVVFNSMHLLYIPFPVQTIYCNSHTKNKHYYSTCPDSCPPAASPATALISVVLPAPEAPMIAVNLPAGKYPVTCVGGEGLGRVWVWGVGFGA